MKKKTCKICKEKFEPVRELQPTCNEYSCMVEYTNNHLSNKKQLDQKKNRKALKQFKNTDVATLKRKAQEVFNKYIRARDKDLPCISCGHNFYVEEPRQRHAGHYRPQGGHSLLRYDERNVHVQCSICNNYKSGNLADYRKALIEKIGLETVEELETMNTMKRWGVEELQEVIDTYKSKIKEIS